MFNKGKYDSLEELGLSPEDIKKAIQDKKDLETKHKTLETELNTTKTTLSTMEGSFGETKRKLAEIEANVNRRTEPDKKEEKTKTSFLDNEDAAFDERFMDRIGPVARTALIGARNSAKMAAKMSLQGKTMTTPGGKISLTRLWEKWEAELEKDAEQVDIGALGNHETWLRMFNYIKGKHIEEMMAEPQTFIESVQSGAERGVREEVKNDKLNDEEKNTVTKMARYGKAKLTEEEYQKNKSKMTFVNV